MAGSPGAKARRLGPRGGSAVALGARDCATREGLIAPARTAADGRRLVGSDVRPGPTAATAFCARSWNSRGGLAKLG